MKFEWDEAKRLANLRKHGIDFRDVMPAFVDPHQLLSVENVDGEERWRLIGLAPDGILLVIYTERRVRLRLISARRATYREQKQYHQSAAY
jgi:uncharacterized protein